MIRIIDGFGRGHNHPQFDESTAQAFMVESGETFTVRAHVLGAGQHVETSAVRDRVMTELDWPLDQIRDHLDMLARYAEENADEISDKSAKRAASRATNRVRRICKAGGLDTLLTLTYRALQDDLGLTKRHLKEFVRRVRRVWPGFRGVAIFEPQKRGAWHIHMAADRVPAELQRNGIKVKSFPLLLSIWRSVTGELGGSFNAKSHKRNSKRSPAKIAAYLSKYLAKAFREGREFMNRFSVYGDFDVAKPVELGRVSSLREALEVCYSLTGELFGVVTARLDRFGGWFYLHAESSPPLLSSS